MPATANNGDMLHVSAEYMAIDTYVESVERRVEFLPKVIRVAIRATNPRDWVDQGGNPYLCGSGAEKIARIFGVVTDSMTYERLEQKDDKGAYYLYIVRGRVSLPAKMTQQGVPLSDSIIAIGTCTSRDVFFAKKYGEWLPMSEIDEGNILKSAYTNFMANGITRLLGLRNLTWEELYEHGVDRDKVSKVEYKGKKQRGTQQPGHNAGRNATAHTQQPARTEKPATQQPGQTTQPPPEQQASGNGGDAPASPEQIKQLAAITESGHLHEFERYMLHKRINSNDLTLQRAQNIIATWKKELGERDTLFKNDRTAYNKHVLQKVMDAQGTYPDEYNEFVNK